MSIIRVYKQQHYKTIDNRFLERTDMSGKAKAVLAYLISRPDNWIVHVDHMINKCFQEGSNWVYSALKELECLSYIERVRIRKADGKLGGIEYSVYEIPLRPGCCESLENKDSQPVHENHQQAQQSPVNENPDQAKHKQVKHEQAIYSNKTKQDINKEEQQQTKEVSVCSFSETDKQLGNTLTENQIKKVAEISISLSEQSSIDAQELAEQIKFVLLDAKAFTQAGTDFQRKLNSIAKVIRQGRWETPSSYQAKGKTTETNFSEISLADERIKKLKDQIHGLALQAHSFEENVRRFSFFPELADLHSQNAKLHRNKLFELKQELLSLTGDTQ